MTLNNAIYGLVHLRTVMAYSSSVIHVGIMKNGIKLITGYSATAHMESGTATVNVHLDAYDMVWVQNQDGAGVQLSDGLYNCFSGALVQADI